MPAARYEASVGLDTICPTCDPDERLLPDRVHLVVAVLLDCFRLLFVQSCQFSSRLMVHPQQLVKFGVKSEAITPIGALDKERHHPDDQCCESIPIESLTAKPYPQKRVGKHYSKGGRMPLPPWSNAF
jgi:hypothetical protein